MAGGSIRPARAFLLSKCVLMPTVSLIINVLDSHEIVRRQCLLLSRIVPNNWEVILVDDGSTPALQPVWTGQARFTCVRTNDYRNWTQPAARNAGVRASTGRTLLLMDIDHVLTPEVINIAHTCKLTRFPRFIADLTPTGEVVNTGKRLNAPPNIFACRRDVFEATGGYDESMCGSYGNDDSEWFSRCRTRANVSTLRLGVLTGDSWDGMFHSLKRSR